MVSFGAGKLATVWDERDPKASGIKNSVGLQLINERGEHLSTSFPTPDSLSAHYPVIIPASDDQLLVVYSVKKDGPGEVWYQRVQVRK